MTDEALGTLCVFAKAPQPGAVKTRLASRVGAEAAAQLARAFLTDTWNTASAVTAGRPVLVLSGNGPLPPLSPDPVIWPQEDGDLGQRLEHALQRALQQAPWALAVGTDSPGVPERLLGQACHRLATGCRSVIGPSEDGGFYLLGVRRCPSGLLQGLAWSAPRTFEHTVERLQQRELDPDVLQTWFDVDEPCDLQRLHHELQAGRIQASATAAALQKLPSSVLSDAR